MLSGTSAEFVSVLQKISSSRGVNLSYYTLHLIKGVQNVLIKGSQLSAMFTGSEANERRKPDQHKT